MKEVIFTVVMLTACVTFVFAAGGKNREGNPVITEDGCVLTLPPLECEEVEQVNGVTLEECELPGQVMILCLDD